MTKRPWRWLLALAVLGCVASIDARQAAGVDVRTAAVTEPVPADPAIRMGTLPNGLRYYVRQNRRPERRAELRLVVRAGSVLEDDDQRGLAHVVEHLAFAGTKNFPGRALQSFLSTLGQPGPDVNARTSFDETIYSLRVPLDNPATLERAMTVLEDWTYNVTFDADAISRERNVVTEEWRRRLGVQERIGERERPILMAGSRYADRSPIGDPEQLRTFAPERLIQFYRDWYRPDLMAVVAVGDFEPAAVEERIRARFSTVPRAESPRPRPVFRIPDQAGARFSIVTDPEATASSVRIVSLRPARDLTTIGGYRQKIVDRLFGNAINARFGEIARRADAPFGGAAATRALFVPSSEQVLISAMVKEGEIERGLAAVIAEGQRAQRFGLTPAEVDRQKESSLRGYERIAAESANRESSALANEYVRHFVSGETLPRPEDEYRLHQRFLPEITLEELNAVARDWFSDRHRVVLAVVPEKAGVAVPNETTLASAIRRGAASELSPREETARVRPLMDELPKPGTIAKTVAIGDTGVTEWTLSNGARVVLKPTTFKEDEVLLRAVSPGGTSLASDEDFMSAATAAPIVAGSGLGEFSATDLQVALTGKIASATPVITDVSAGVIGSASKRDVETLMQLVHMRFARPRVDRGVFELAAARTRAQLANQTTSPDVAFQRAVGAALAQDHPRARPPTAADVDRWNLDRSMRFYRERFADASGFTFVLVGSFDLDTMRPLVEQYLASLPSTHRQETWRDLGIRPPTGVVEKTVLKGIEPKAQVAMVFTGPLEAGVMNELALRSVTAVLAGRLQQSLRQQLGATYTISAGAVVQRAPVLQYAVRIQWTCDPARVEELAARVFAEVERVKTMAVTMTGLRATMLQNFPASIQTNGYLLQELVRTYEFGGDVADIWKVPEFFEQLDLPALQRAARTYLDPQRYVRVTLLPETR